MNNDNLDSPAGEGVLPLHNELVTVAADELDVPAMNQHVRGSSTFPFFVSRRVSSLKTR